MTAHAQSPAFLHAAEIGDVKTIRHMLATRRPADFPVHEKNTALSLASKGGHLECVLALLPVCCPEVDHSAALRSAAECGHLEVVRALIPVSLPNAQRADALWKSAAHGYTDIVLELLPLFEPSTRSIHAALLTVCGTGHLDVARALLSKGQPSADNRHACLVHATTHKHASIVQALYEHSPKDVLSSALDMIDMDRTSNIEDPTAARRSKEKTFAIINTVGDHWSTKDLQQLTTALLASGAHLSECPRLQAHHEQRFLQNELGLSKSTHPSAFHFKM